MPNSLRAGLVLRTLWSVALAHMLGTCSLAAAATPDEKDAGRLRVAVYTDFAPFSDHDQGIDVDIGSALAAKMGLVVEVVSFKNADDVQGDLRNILWKGHYLWHGRLADVMMHVPVDDRLAKQVEQVRIFAPYFRQRLVVARNRNRIPQLVTLQVFTSERIGVQFDTLEDHYLMTSFGSVLRENVVHFATIAQAVEALRKNEVAAVIGRQTLIEAALGGATGAFEVGPVATPGLSLSGWNIGVAVKADKPELADAVDRAMADLLKDGTIERIFTKRGLTYLPPVSR